ncbi:hypothetical protein J2X19_002207 [Rhodoferax ferrireducens]|uniref:Uncharacterized protein n=1 Tax=Rhodoferax ferrireducens TaxID=192843 RepID=A0ABU2C871_9BURK|nr:DUF6678 family protein [Rhodoferax ferrireducens]MDR7377528.1 hypothetical protein [Rhodoferax ferrireducens]
MPERHYTVKLRRYLADQQLVSVLNTTKWKRLLDELCREDLPLHFHRKDINESERPEQRWDGDIFHVFGDCEIIEWLEIRAKLSVSRGQLLEPEIHDFTDKLIAATRRAKVPFSLTHEGIRVWGYIRAGSDVQWATDSDH